MSNIEKHSAQGIQVQTLDEAMRYAEAMSGAGMIPEKFKGQPANVLVAQEIAHTLEESTWMVMSELYFVGSVPTFSAKFMRSRIRQAGHKLREYFDKETMTARAVIIRHDDPEHEHVAEWDEEKARKHDLWGKNHWLKNPELMLKNRALSEVMREACYEVMGGIAYTSDEAQDFVRMDSQRMDQQAPQPAPQNAPQGQSQQRSVPQPPAADDWAARLEKLEQAGEVDKVAANMNWARDRGHGELFEMARGVHERMLAAQEPAQATDGAEGSAQPSGASPSPQEAQETAQQVLDAELVEDDRHVS